MERERIAPDGARAPRRRDPAECARSCDRADSGGESLERALESDDHCSRKNEYDDRHQQRERREGHLARASVGQMLERLLYEEERKRCERHP